MKNVYFVQASIDFGHDTGAWIPYSCGCLWAYAYQHDFVKDNFVLKDIIFRRDNHTDILTRMEDPAVVAFSCYVWNANYSLTLAKAIKERWPNCVIVVGGPQANSTWTQYSFIDSIVIGEGEIPFTNILKSIVEGTPVNLFENGKLTALDIPSPYITGVFDTIINDNPELSWWMVMESTRGCPYSCTFCDWGGINTKVRKFEIERIKADIEWAVNHNVAILLMPDANFGIFKERDLEIARILRNAADRSKIQQIQFTYAKNTNDTCFEIDKILGPYSYGLTVSVQSMTQKTLEVIKRSIMKMNDLEYVFELAKKHGSRTYTELILGLPEETLDDFKNGLDRLLNLGQHDQIQVWLATIIPNAEMASPEYLRKYNIKTKKVKVYQDENSFEETEFVVSTNAMSFEDLVEAYMYAWMVLNFHHTGFSELLAKYCKHIKNISYREFYDRLFARLPNDPNVGPIYNNFKNNVVELLSKGESNNSPKYIISLDCEIENYYDLKEQFVSAAVESARDLVTEDIVELQKIYNLDSNTMYPIRVKSKINISTWKEQETNYIVTIPNEPEDSNRDFYDLSSRKFYSKLHFKVI